MNASAAVIGAPDTGGRHHFTIADLAGEFGITARTLRFYEDEGLIVPARMGLSRIYSRRDRARLAWIVRGKRVGFSLAEIREMIDLHDRGTDRRFQRRVTIERCEDKIDTLLRHRRDLDSAIEALRGFVARAKPEGDRG